MEALRGGQSDSTIAAGDDGYFPSQSCHGDTPFEMAGKAEEHLAGCFDTLMTIEMKSFTSFLLCAKKCNRAVDIASIF
jgi:hypothetical protein